MLWLPLFHCLSTIIPEPRSCVYTRNYVLACASTSGRDFCFCIHPKIRYFASAKGTRWFPHPIPGTAMDRAKTSQDTPKCFQGTLKYWGCWCLYECIYIYVYVFMGAVKLNESALPATAGICRLVLLHPRCLGRPNIIGAIYICICMYIHIYVNECIYIYICVCIHTYDMLM